MLNRIPPVHLISQTGYDNPENWNLFYDSGYVNYLWPDDPKSFGISLFPELAEPLCYGFFESGLKVFYNVNMPVDLR
jgi:hypothetical protein